MQPRCPFTAGARLLGWGVFANLAAGPLAAGDPRVEKSAQLVSVRKSPRGGDIVTLENGEWQDAKFVINQGDSAGKPIEIRAETPGGVRLSGASAVAINAPYVTVGGLLFQDGATTHRAAIQFKSHHRIVRNTAIIDHNPASFATECSRVFFAGTTNPSNAALWREGTINIP